jgi:XTP/dITP diphosphohydrolase
MSSSTRLVVASNNPGKLREFAALLAPLGYDVVTQGELGIGEAEEPFDTFVENALVKARHASAASGLPALADDSGLCVPSLGGLPGVRSARYAATDRARPREEQDRLNNEKLVAALARSDARDGYYVSCLVLVRSVDDPEPVVAIGRWPGRIVDVPRGSNGFGYDPYFLVPSLGATVAELDLATKNRISHRAIALRRLAEALAERAA